MNINIINKIPEKTEFPELGRISTVDYMVQMKKGGPIYHVVYIAKKYTKDGKFTGLYDPKSGDVITVDATDRPYKLYKIVTKNVDIREVDSYE